MQKRFRTYHKYNYKKYKYLIYIMLVIIGFIFTLKALFKNFKDSVNYDNLLSIGSNNIIKDYSILNLLNISLSTPDNILSLSFSDINKKNNINHKENIPVIKETKQNEPIVYIYNTHQTEEYDAGLLKNYNITPTVYMAANILKKKLANLNITSIVEDENIGLVLKEHNWKYKDSYYASRLWLEKIKMTSPSIKYYIDLHRDSITRSTIINDMSYAKLMFVIGMNHDNYKENEKLVLKLNDYLKENYPGLMRDILYAKKNKFNQDFNSNTILVEVGGPKNNIEEVQNSVNALADAISHVIRNR